MWKRVLRLAIVAACVAAMAWTVHRLGPARVLDAALGADPRWLSAAAVPLLARFLVWGRKWQRMLRRHADVPYGFCVRALAAGSFANLTTPTAKLAGGVVRALLLRRRHGWDLATAYGWSMADQVTNVLGHVLLYGMLAVPASAVLPPGPLRGALLASGCVALAGIGAVVALRPLGWRIVRSPSIRHRIAASIPRRFRPGAGTGEADDAWVDRVFRPLLREGGALGVFLPDLLWGSASLFCLCLSNAMVLVALGIDLSPLMGAVLVVLGSFAGVVVGAWGGVGVTEAALTALYVEFGVPADLAAAGALLHRAMFYGLVLIVALPTVVRETGAAATRR